LIFKYYIN